MCVLLVFPFVYEDQSAKITPSGFRACALRFDVLCELGTCVCSERTGSIHGQSPQTELIFVSQAIMISEVPPIPVREFAAYCFNRLACWPSPPGESLIHSTSHVSAEAACGKHRYLRGQH